MLYLEVFEGFGAAPGSLRPLALPQAPPHLEPGQGEWDDAWNTSETSKYSPKRHFDPNFGIKRPYNNFEGHIIKWKFHLHVTNVEISS